MAIQILSNGPAGTTTMGKEAVVIFPCGTPGIIYRHMLVSVKVVGGASGMIVGGAFALSFDCGKTWMCGANNDNPLVLSGLDFGENETLHLMRIGKSNVTIWVTLW